METILSDILLAETPVGDRLLPERELADRLGVSRTVVRDALQQLREQGIVRTRQGGGNYFMGLDGREEAIRRLQDRAERVQSVLEIRLVIDPEIAALAAERATPSTLSGLDRAMKSMEKDIDSGGLGFSGERDFHRRLTTAAGNPLFEELMAVLGPRLAELRSEALLQGIGPGLSLEDHRLIFGAIADRDAAAARESMRAHLDKLSNFKLFDHLARWGSDDD